jgi:hypothetical protein
MIRGIALGGLFLAAAGIAAPAQAQNCTVFLDQAAFEAFNMDHGKAMKGLEDFEPPVGNVPANSYALLTNTLEGNIPNVDGGGFGFPSGLANKNLKIQTNPAPYNAEFPAPSSSLIAMGQDFLGPGVPNSIVVGPNLFDESLDLIFLPGETHTGVGFDVIAPLPAGTDTAHVSVFDNNNVMIAQTAVPLAAGKTFFGIWCPESIGRINIGAADPAGAAGGELVDNIQMWMEVQEPTCPWDCGYPPNKMVDIIDFLALLGEWGGVDTPCDFDGGGVGITDFLKLLGAWGLCPPPYNNMCINQLPIDKSNPQTTTEVTFDMYGARPSPDQPYACLPNPPDFKDIWYCLTNSTASTIGVTITTTLALYIEVYQGCNCDPLGPLVVCGEGQVGTEQFVMLDAEQVLIRVIDHLNLPNDELKGAMFVESKPVGAAVNFFTDEVLFDEAAAQASKLYKFVWDFNPHDQPSGIPALDDPLDIDTHGLNADDPWTDSGGTNLWPPVVDNVQFSANLTPGGALNPRGVDGMAFLWQGNWPGIDNNALVANFPTDSFDIVSGLPVAANHTAMKLEIISVAGSVPTTIRIRVFDQDDLVMGTFLLDYQGGKAFLGILSKDPASAIKRVDIHDVSDGAEGISFIQCYHPYAGFNFFTERVTFEDELASQGKVQKVYWEFKPDNVPAGAPGIGINDDPPLDINTHPDNAPGIWEGRWPPEADNVQFASNINPQGMWVPRGLQGMVYWKAGSPPPNLGANALLANWAQDSFDLLSGPPAGDNHTAIQVELIQLPGYGHPDPVFHISVYDKIERQIGEFILPGVPGEPAFLGMIAKDPGDTIGRVDIWDESGGFEGITSFGLFSQPAPP